MSLHALAAAPQTSPIRVTVTGADRVWIATTTTRGALRTSMRSVAGGATVDIDADAEPLFVCVGAVARATVCEEVAPGDERVRHVALDEGRNVRGRVVVGRTPLAKAVVRVRPDALESERPLTIPLAYDGRQWTMSVTTDDDGRFAIEHLSSGSYVLEVSTASGRTEDSEAISVPALAARKDGEAPPQRSYELPEIRIAEGLRAAVEVRTPDGIPIPGAAIEASQRRPDGRDSVIGATAGSDGTASLDGLTPGLPIRLGCAAKGFARSYEVIETLPPLLTCTLQPLGGIKGTVVDAHRRPVAGAMVELKGENVRATTDAAGAFEITDLRSGAYAIRVSARGSGVMNDKVDVKSGEVTDAGSIRLPDAVVLRGRVIDAATRRGVANADVVAVDPPVGATAVTDGDGAFTLPGDSATGLRVKVSAAGFAPAYAAMQPPSHSGADDRGTIVSLERAGALEIRAWDDATGEECRACTIVISNGNETLEQIADASGIARQNGLAPGQYFVTRERVSATSRLVTVSGGDDTESALVRAGETTHVELGTPARDVTVALLPAPSAEWKLVAVSGSRVVFGSPLPARGNFQFRKRASERYELRLESPSATVVVGVVPAAYS
ncbi:MAG: carboxypeptidase-like regulatory domain-containing protein, partial [Acidobacteriota bacterium]|nr:carboxypeptidase-like regulatory domain-containing protein [Acidobacteriota bacterium]